MENSGFSADGGGNRRRRSVAGNGGTGLPDVPI